MEEPFKNPLLGQLNELGLNLDVDSEANPLSIHIENFDIENSPFGNLNKTVENPIEENGSSSKKVVQKRLNDYDFNILQDSAFVDIEDIELSDDEKVKKITNLINQIDNKLFLIEGRTNSPLREKLLKDRETLEKILEKLQTKKTSIVPEEIKNGINSKTSVVLDKIRPYLPQKNIIGKFLFKCFPKIYKGFLMKKALNKLEALNQTTKELINLKIPYGESDQRYDALIEYLSSANTIHAKLIKKI